MLKAGCSHQETPAPHILILCGFTLSLNGMGRLNRLLSAARFIARLRPAMKAGGCEKDAPPVLHGAAPPCRACAPLIHEDRAATPFGYTFAWLFTVA